MQKTVRNISFAEKARIFSHDYLLCCTYISGADFSQNLFTKKLYSKQRSEATSLNSQFSIFNLQLKGRSDSTNQQSTTNNFDHVQKL